ncbi:hypothetical protein [Salipiger sp. PrR003]|uniref:hypothetical protein n=1 Tax=Salipiger sp. PrR003 TaxID=2706776 RepID=UPI0013DA903B|nr:hypothetical protein [Salipiger sp. PrR003]NDV50171.1 hypothetical protein [Salipiger sp. PrR003]
MNQKILKMMMERQGKDPAQQDILKLVRGLLLCTAATGSLALIARVLTHRPEALGGASLAWTLSLLAMVAVPGAAALLVHRAIARRQPEPAANDTAGEED